MIDIENLKEKKIELLTVNNKRLSIFFGVVLVAENEADVLSLSLIVIKM
jgi:hypothetical protein